MCMFNSKESYGIVSKVLHWLIALIVLGMLCVGLSFNYFPGYASTLMPIHKSMGVTLLLLMVLRLLWRWGNTVPSLTVEMKRWEKFLALLVHYAFYILLIAMPITGIVMTLAGGHPLPFWSFGQIHLSFIPLNTALSHLMNRWHLYLAWAIVVLGALHTAAALKHHFHDKDSILKRML